MPSYSSVLRMVAPTLVAFAAGQDVWAALSVTGVPLADAVADAAAGCGAATDCGAAAVTSEAAPLRPGSAAWRVIDHTRAASRTSPAISAASGTNGPVSGSQSPVSGLRPPTLRISSRGRPC